MSGYMLCATTDLAYPRSLTLLCNVRVRKWQELGVHWVMIMPKNAEPELVRIPAQDEAVCPLSIDFTSFAPLWVILHCSTPRRECLIVLILTVHSHTFDNRLIMTDCLALPWPVVQPSCFVIAEKASMLTCWYVTASCILMAFQSWFDSIQLWSMMGWWADGLIGRLMKYVNVNDFGHLKQAGLLT